MPKLLCNFIEIAVRHECFPVNMLQHLWTVASSVYGFLRIKKMISNRNFQYMATSTIYFKISHI